MMMRLLLLLSVLLAPSVGEAALSKSLLGSNVSADGSTFTTMSVAGVNTTGCTHAVVYTKHEGATTTITVTDNKSSGTYTALTKTTHSNTDFHAQLHWVQLGTPGTSTTITMTMGAARTWGQIIAWCVTSGTGALAVDVEAAGGQGSSTAPDAGTLSTTTATASFMGVGEYSAATYTASSGWTEDVDNSGYGASRTDASGTLDPAATASGSIPWVAVAASFKESGGGGGGGGGTKGLLMGVYP